MTLIVTPYAVGFSGSQGHDADAVVLSLEVPGVVVDESRQPTKIRVVKLDKILVFMAKYKLTWKDLSWNYFKVYLFALFKAFIPKKKISDLDELEDFIQTKSAWVTQVALYGYLKTRMGTRYVLHFENDEFMGSVNLAKWNMGEKTIHGRL